MSLAIDIGSPALFRHPSVRRLLALLRPTLRLATEPENITGDTTLCGIGMHGALCLFIHIGVDPLTTMRHFDYLRRVMPDLVNDLVEFVFARRTDWEFVVLQTRLEECDCDMQDPLIKLIHSEELSQFSEKDTGKQIFEFVVRYVHIFMLSLRDDELLEFAVSKKRDPMDDGLVNLARYVFRDTEDLIATCARCLTDRLPNPWYIGILASAMGQHSPALVKTLAAAPGLIQHLAIQVVTGGNILQMMFPGMGGNQHPSVLGIIQDLGRFFSSALLMHPPLRGESADMLRPIAKLLYSGIIQTLPTLRNSKWQWEGLAGAIPADCLYKNKGKSNPKDKERDVWSFIGRMIHALIPAAERQPISPNLLIKPWGNPEFADVTIHVTMEEHAHLLLYLYATYNTYKGCSNPDCSVGEPAEGKPRLSRCGSCKLFHYCSAECQTSAWAHDTYPHKDVCKIWKTLSTAWFLFGRVPNHPDMLWPLLDLDDSPELSNIRLRALAESSGVLKKKEQLKRLFFVSSGTLMKHSGVPLDGGMVLRIEMKKETVTPKGEAEIVGKTETDGDVKTPVVA